MEENKNCEGLTYLTWSRFDSPDQPGSGYKYMEREPVLLLDEVVRKTRMSLKIEMGYVSPRYARILGLPTHDSHRIGKAVRLRVTSSKKRMRVVAALIKEGVTRIALTDETVYFDTDEQKPDWLCLW